MKKILAICFTLGVLSLNPAWAMAKTDSVELREGHPKHHVVEKGDTLWDISGRFLEKPWHWPRVWDVNPQIENPHLIYPGDIIYLVWVNGEPRLSMKPGDGRLQPRARVTPLERAIPAIPLKDLYSFLSENVVLDDELLRETPYVLGGKNDRIIAGAGDRIYARGELEETKGTMVLYRPAKEFTDPDSGELLGYELFKVAEAKVAAVKEDVVSLDLKSSHVEVRVLDRVLPSPEGRIQSIFYPDAAPEESEGYILSVNRGVDKIGRFDTVAINQGERDGVKNGHVYEIFRRGEAIKDPISGKTVELPSEKAGTLMVFRAYERVSYAVVMSATNVLSVGDKVRSPDFIEY